MKIQEIAAKAWDAANTDFCLNFTLPGICINLFPVFTIRMTTLNIWNSFEDRLYGFIFDKVRDHDLSKDLLQDVFEKIHLKIDTLKSEDKLSSWLFTITRNIINDHYRKKKESVELTDHFEADVNLDKNPTDVLISCLIPFLEKLPKPYKTVLHQYQFEKIPQKEIAKQLGVPAATVRSQIQRARKMLQEQFINCCSEQLDNSGINVESFLERNDCKTC